MCHLRTLWLKWRRPSSCCWKRCLRRSWQDMASPLDVGHRTTKCKYRMPCRAGQHPSYWSANGQVQCYRGQHQWLERKGPFSRGSSTHDIANRPDAVKSSHNAVFSLLHADGQQLWPQGLVLSRLYSLLLNILTNWTVLHFLSGIIFLVMCMSVILCLLLPVFNSPLGFWVDTK